MEDYTWLFLVFITSTKQDNKLDLRKVHLAKGKERKYKKIYK